jgi:hypothetical protein
MTLGERMRMLMQVVSNAQTALRVVKEWMAKEREGYKTGSAALRARLQAVCDGRSREADKLWKQVPFYAFQRLVRKRRDS